MNTTFGDRLKLLRKEKKISQDDLGRDLGLTRQSISNYETNKRQPDYETLEIIADYFNVDIDYLLGKKDTRNDYSEHEAEGAFFRLDLSQYSQKDREKMEEELRNYYNFLKSKLEG